MVLNTDYQLASEKLVEELDTSTSSKSTDSTYNVHEERKETEDKDCSCQI